MVENRVSNETGQSWDFLGQEQEQNHYLIGKTKVKKIKQLSKNFFQKLGFFPVKVPTRPVLGQ